MITAELNQPKVQQGAARDVDGVAAGVDEHQCEEYHRGYADGIVWAGAYATADELRNLADSAEPGPHNNSPHWRGFLAGAEEVLDERACMEVPTS